MLSWVEQEKSLITSGLGPRLCLVLLHADSKDSAEFALGTQVVLLVCHAITEGSTRPGGFKTLFHAQLNCA